MTRAELLASLAAAAVAPAAVNAAALPVTLSPYGLIFVPITVGGVETVAMVDTGSFARVQISRRLAARLRLVTVSGSDTAQGYAFGKTAVERATTSLAIGPVVEAAAEVTVVGTTLESVSERVRTEFDALLGWGFVRERACRIDYPARRFTFGPPRGAVKAALPYREVNRAPIVDVVAAGKRVAMLFDTGAPTCVLDTEKFGIAPNTFRDVDYAFAGITATLRTLGRDLSVNAALGIGGVIGTNALERYTLGVDPAAHRFTLG